MQRQPDDRSKNCRFRLFVRLFSCWVQTEMNQLLAHGGAGHPEPADGLCLIALRLLNSPGEQLSLHLFDHFGVDAVRLSALSLGQQSGKITSNGLIGN